VVDFLDSWASRALQPYMDAARMRRVHVSSSLVGSVGGRLAG
jgi:hypothetical protein